MPTPSGRTSPRPCAAQAMLTAPVNSDRQYRATSCRLSRYGGTIQAIAQTAPQVIAARQQRRTTTVATIFGAASRLAATLRTPAVFRPHVAIHVPWTVRD